FLVKLRKCER
ncbi:hypothetical protein OYC64_008387, partial [Pagothenia borchgrevinki]